LNTGRIVYQILMQGADLFRRDAAEAEQAVDNLAQAADESAEQSTQAGGAVENLGRRARGARAGLDGASESTRSLRQEVTGLSEDGQRAASKVGTAALGIGAAIAIVGGLAVASYSQFDAAMSRTAAATSAAADEQRELSEAAIDAGADTVFSATEAAGAQTELAKAGLSVKNILTGGLTGSLSLAAAGELDVARAAEIAAITLKQFNLDGTQTARVADTLSAGAGKAVGSVDDLANGLKFVGPIASAMGISLEETVGVLALFADQGIIGEQAGTAFRGMLGSLTSPSKIARDEISRLGITLYDNQGKFLGMENAAAQLQGAYKGMSDQQRDASLGILFGNEQITAARILYKGGAEAVNEYTGAVTAQGFAAHQAWQLTDNLIGDVERLGGAFDSALIQTGEGANGALREMVQILTSLVDWYGELPDSVQQGTFLVGAFAAIVAIAGGAMLVTIPKIIEFRAAMSTLVTQMPKTTIAVGAVAAAVAGAAIVFGMFLARQADVKAGAQELASTLDEQTGAFTANTRATVANLLETKGAYGNAMRAAGISQKELTDAVIEGGDALDAVKKKLGAENTIASFFDGTGIAAGNASQSIGEVRDSLDLAQTSHENLKAATEGTAAATDANAESTSTAADAYIEAAGGADDLLSSLTDLINIINESNDAGQDAISKNIDYRNSMDELNAVIQGAREGIDANNDGVADYSLTLDQNTQAGRDNMQMVLDMAEAGRVAAEAQFALDGNTQLYRESLEASRQAVIDRAMDLGYNAEQATALADKIAQIPSETEWQIIAETAAASSAADAFIAKYNGVQITAQLFLETSGGDRGLAASAARYTAQAQAQLAQAEGGKVNFYADGGYENHVAQFAKAGTTRVWAEPETGGEYYIPAHPAKRGRSTQVLAAAAAEFGLALVPAGAQAFADGGRGGDVITTSSGGNTYAPSVSVVVDGQPDPWEIARAAGKEISKAIERQGN
jgi:TP901 family phage tail tape measure protein